MKYQDLREARCIANTYSLERLIAMAGFIRWGATKRDKQVFNIAVRLKQEERFYGMRKT